MNKETLKQYEIASRLLRQAAEILNNIKSMDPQDHDAIHFSNQVQEIISCDHGEAGLKPLVNKMRGLIK